MARLKDRNEAFLRKRYLKLANYCKNKYNTEVDFDFDFWKSLVFQNCSYCGDPPSNKNYISPKENKSDSKMIVGIDRVDSSKPYQRDNIVPCCKICNLMKNKFTKDFFIQRAHKISERHNQNG